LMALHKNAFHLKETEKKRKEGDNY
jgi:hypothetical protein